ncbi:RNA-binding protein 7 [Bombyx mandarina]|uniref:RRM domain-containing protein n=2 Tax=Bombyx TaxID=7090 RepID=A0A8R1WIK6_BOMMO|nr:RNA-binding protein 7 [Bombyx mori]XP_028040260.1 RNA-binding protein 7 [Bombyx mandarina]XP_028040261.1 RNA-binding protein 7 [Bombyx mandarina]
MIDKNNRTLWCGNLPEQITEELLYELFLQAGPLEKVRIAKDRDGRQRNFAFITFCHEVSVPYAILLFRGTTLFNRTISLQCRSRMAILPPPLRCYGPEFQNHPPETYLVEPPPNIAQQFAHMTNNLMEEEVNFVHSPNNFNDLSIASLQGNWSHRHHPYPTQEYYSRDNFRPRESEHYNRSKHSNNWRDRKSKRNGNHRRD